MAGGTFDKGVGKVRPGTYINFESTKQNPVSASERGTVIIPLANTNWGEGGKMLTISASAPDSQKLELGYSINDNDPAGNMLLIREAFKGANTVIVYICTEGATKATKTGGGMVATAKYKGSRGNDLSFSVVANPVSGFDVTIFLAGEVVEKFTGITTATGLAGSEWIQFAAHESDPVSAVASVALEGGTNSSSSNAGVTAFLGACETVAWNTMAFPFTDASLQAAALSKIKHLRENVGKYVQAVCPNFTADYEGIINVANGYQLEGTNLTAAQATAYVAGITAGAASTESNTQKAVAGAIGIQTPLTHDEVVAGINAGKFMFTLSDNGAVVCEYDINSLVSFTDKKNSSYRKNKVIRVYDSFGEALKANFPPNRFNNDEEGWQVMEGIGKMLLKQFGPRSDGGSGALKNIDYTADFVVDRENSVGDQTYFNVGIEPVDSAEKLYFTVCTR